VVDHLDEIGKVPAYDGKEPLTGQLRALNRKTHLTIKKVTEDIENRFHFNTAISAVMELVNEINQFLNQRGKKDDLVWSVVREAIETTVVLLSPVVPHITEELWDMLGHDGALLKLPWPAYRPEALKAEIKLIVVQVNGKVRSRIEVPTSHGDEEIKTEALSDERVQRFINGKSIKKIIVVQKKLVNIVV
jgi:leucyl-tRNA synthetase